MTINAFIIGLALACIVSQMIHKDGGIECTWVKITLASVITYWLVNLVVFTNI